MLRSKGKYIFLVCLVVLIAVAATITWQHSQGSPPKLIIPRNPTPTSPAATHPPTDGYGLYESCPPSVGETCFKQLAQIARGGFKLVINYRQLSGTLDEELRYAYQAKLLGLKIIWNFSDYRLLDASQYNPRTIYPSLITSCHCSNTVDFIRYVVNQVKYLPATWGYYVGDEVPPDQHELVKHLSDIIHSADPHHLRLFVARSQGAYANSDLATFADSADILMQDFYPIGHYKNLQTTEAIASGVQAIADQYHKGSGMVLQAFSLAQFPAYHNLCTSVSACPYPTVAQMQQMRDLALQHATPRLILWYSYDAIQRSDNPQLRWNNLLAALHGHS